MYWSYDEEIVPDLHRTPGGANLSPQTRSDRSAAPDRSRGHAHCDALRRDDEAFDFSWSARAGGGFFLPGTVTSSASRR
jgi:hypothetical protein